MAVKTPDWVKQAVFYQIFPDRFARSQRIQHPRGIAFRAWGSPPEEQGYQGGDLYGIVEKLDYLQELGVTALYLNPVFASASNHRYHTYDYFQVDPLLGGNDALRTLLDSAHARQMRVVLDGVFNHASRGFWAFHHILENGGDSPYLDWFLIQDWPLRPYNNEENKPINYVAWWGIAALPKFNIANPGVRDYLLSVARHWVEFGIDGWRIDVPEEIDDELFWQDFRRVIKTANPEAYIVGEIWHAAQDWLAGDRFDAVMNYMLSRAALGFFAAETVRLDYKPGGFQLAPLNGHAFALAVEQILGLYDWSIVQAQLNVLDSHDTARALWMMNSDESALQLCTLFQMTMPGAPCIYYGNEIGMSSASDPHCRAAFPWHERSSWNEDLLHYYRRSIALRRRHPVLSLGDFRTLYGDQHLYAFRRATDNAAAIVIFNTGHHEATLQLNNLPAQDEGCTFVDGWHVGRYSVQNGKLASVKVPARDAVVLIR